MVTAMLLASVAAVSPLAAAADAVTPASCVRPGTLCLSAEQLFRLAEEAAAKGDVETLGTIYVALEHDPSSAVRNEARFRHAKLLKSKGMNSGAAVLLRAILDEYPAAGPVRLELAETLQLIGDTDGALRELRAAQSGGLPPAVARLVDRYSEALRASRPIGASFEMAIAPDSNINRATRSDTLGTVFGDFEIGEDSKARSGVGLALRGQAYRRLAIAGTNLNLLGRVSTSADMYRESSFNDIAIDAAFGPELRAGRNRFNLEVGATQRWFGQKPFMRSARIAGTWTRPLGSRTQVRLNGSASLVDNSLNDLQDGKSYSARVQVERAFSPTTGIGVTMSIHREAAKDPGYSTTAWRAGVLAWHDMGRMTVTAAAEAGKLEADERLLLFPAKRLDDYSRLTIGATFRQLTFGGFAPVTRFTVERNRSSIEFYDYSHTRTEFAIVRAF